MSAAAATAPVSISSKLAQLGGYAPIPQTFWTVLPQKTGGFSVQHGMIGFIMAQTYGAPRGRKSPAPDWSEPITMKRFAEVSGVSERHCQAELEDAYIGGLIRRKKVERGYVYQAAPENWAEAPGRAERDKLRDELAPKKPMGKEGEEEAKHTGTAVRVSLQPGQRKHPVFKVEAETKVKCVNESSAAQLTIEDGENGVIRVRVSDFADTGSGVPVLNGHVNGNNRSTVSVGQLHELLDDYFRRRHGKLPDNPLLIRIASALRPATFDHYKRLVHDRWRKGDVVGAGVLLAIAEEAGRAAVAHTEKASAAERHKVEESQKLSLDSLLDALRMVEDPLAKEILDSADPEMLAQARRLL